MKRILTPIACFFVLGFLNLSCNGDDSQEVINDEMCLPSGLQQGLIAYYPFSGGSLNDFAGTAHLTSANAQPAQDRDGNAGCAYGFDAANSSMLTTQNTAFLNGHDALTIALWYKPVGDWDYEILFERKQGVEEQGNYSDLTVGLYDCRKAFFAMEYFNAWDNDISDMQNFTCEGETQARSGIWHFLTATYSQADGELKLYRNGVPQENATGMANYSLPQDLQHLGDLFIGKDFTGSIDDIAVYNRVLSQAEISQLYQVAPCCQ